MADIILFHHAQGLTPGVLAFADELRVHGHRVTVPDLYGGATFSTVDDNVAHSEEIGFDTIIERVATKLKSLRRGFVYAGFSLGAFPAQELAQTVDGCRGAILYHGCVPVNTFGIEWPLDVPLQLHLMDQDPWSPVEVAEDLARTARDGALYIYPGSGHLFTDSSLAEYDPNATRLVLERTLSLLSRIG